MELAPTDVGTVAEEAVWEGGWKQAFCAGHAEFEMLLDVYVSTEI